ncbi:unnamed protein product, partial [Ectocarpus sp. 4 AP-2014]
TTSATWTTTSGSRLSSSVPHRRAERPGGWRLNDSEWKRVVLPNNILQCWCLVRCLVVLSDATFITERLIPKR